MLDMSGSMDGQKWQDLVRAVEQFLRTLESDAAQADSSKVTIITYESYAQLTYN
jgi:uncharacterized protein YegL